MGMTVEIFGSKEDADNFIASRNLKSFGNVIIREVVSQGKTIYRVNINRIGYNAYQNYLVENTSFLEKRKPAQAIT